MELSCFGKPFNGWQKQHNAYSVQGVLEEAMTTLLGTDIALVGAGRTDAGVHSEQMFAHFDVDSPLPEGFKNRLNAFLSKDIAIIGIHPVKDTAHARYDAIKRTYRYQIVRKKNPFVQDLAYYYYRPLDISKMNDAAKKILGYHDFKCFSKSKTDVKTYFCDVSEASWEEVGDVLIFTIASNRFLRNMVRAVVGTLLEVGTGKISLEDIEHIINQKNRSLAGVSVPARGLYLAKIFYPPDLFIS